MSLLPQNSLSETTRNRNAFEGIRAQIRDLRTDEAPGYHSGEASCPFLRICTFRDTQQRRITLDRMVDAMA